MDAKNVSIFTTATTDETPSEKTKQDESQTDNEIVSADVVARLIKTPVVESIVDGRTNKELMRLQFENATLKTQIVALKNALRAFTE